MKLITSLIGVASVNAACECLGETSAEFPGPVLFNTKGRPGDFGAYCKAWDVDTPNCQKGEVNAEKEWCVNEWCYVSADNDCDPAAYPTDEFADNDEWAGKLKFSTADACPKKEAYVAEGSLAIYASTIAISVGAIAMNL